MRRGDDLTPGAITLVLVGLLDTMLVALLLYGIGFGTARGLQSVWNALLAGLAGVPPIGGRLAAALLIPFLLWAAIRPGEFRRKPGPIHG